MDPCPECGNHAVAAHRRGEAVVHECGLCGAVVGEPRTGRGAQALAELIGSLPGLRIVRSAEGDPGRAELPALHWQVLDGRGLLQLENLSKSLQLARGQLQLPWRLEVDFDRALVFTLQPRPAAVDAAAVRLARRDLELLAQAVLRDSRLSWWVRPRG
jgi:ribosomal protein S27E